MNIFRAVRDNVELSKELYQHFKYKMGKGEDNIDKINELLHFVKSKNDQTILETFLKFNNSVVKTNFYKNNRSASVFRFDPSKCMSLKN